MLSLSIVDQFILKHDLPASENQRAFALMTVTIDLIANIYEQLFVAIHNDTPPSPQTRQEVVSLAQADASARAESLLSWSVLYVLHVHSALDVPKSDLASAYGMTARNLRRYQAQGVQRLTDALVRLEWEAITHLQQVRLVARLPYAARTLLGRDDALGDLLSGYRQGQRTLMITGAAGIGKSHLATHFLERIVRDPSTAPRHLIWLHQPRDVQAVVEQASNILAPGLYSSTLREYAFTHDIVLVIDEGEALLPDFAALRRELGHVYVLCLVRTCAQADVLASVDVHIHLGPLGVQDAHMLYQVTHQSNTHAATHEAREVVTRGNPREIRAYARQSAFPFAWADHRTPDAQAFIGMFALLSHQRVVQADLAPNPQQKAQLDNWLKTGLLHTERNSLHLDDAVGQLIWSRWQRGEDKNVLHHITEYLVEGMAGESVWSIASQLAAAENLLDKLADVLLPQQVERLAEAFWRIALRSGRVTKWVSLLNNLQVQSTPIQVAYAVLLSRAGMVDLSHQLLHDISRECGIAGRFQEQAAAMLEQAVLLRRQGRYAAAGAVLERLMNRSLPAQLRGLVDLERVRLLLGAGAADEAMLAWESVRAFEPPTPSSSIIMDLLECELLLLHEQVDQAVAILNDLDGADTVGLGGHRHALLARTYVITKQFAEAEDCFQLAVNDLQVSEDTYVAARVATNFAALLLDRQEYSRALEILQWSRGKQSINGDRVGLVSTHHNLAIAQRRIANTS